MLLSLGLLSFGLVHLVIGGLAIYVAVGLDANPSYSGALRVVAARPLGALLMWAMAVGLGTLTAWQLGWAVTWKERDERWTRPVGAMGRATTYAVLALLALGTIRASDEAVTGSSTVSEHVLDNGLGRIVVIGIAVGVGAVGVAKIGRGIRRTFVEDLNGSVGRGTVIIGVIGHLAKGLVLVSVGILLLWAGLTNDPADVGGVDLALARVRAHPLGPLVLIGIGAGLNCYGVYCLIWSSRPRIAGRRSADED